MPVTRLLPLGCVVQLKRVGSRAEGPDCAFVPSADVIVNPGTGLSSTYPGWYMSIITGVFFDSPGQVNQ